MSENVSLIYSGPLMAANAFFIVMELLVG
jgi:hypothetical protein